MYLSALEIKNFKSCYETKLKLGPSLTLLVGENNSGKSNVIDALRLATTPLDKKRTRWFDRDDPSWGREGQNIEISTQFDGLSDFQKGQYVTALDLTSGSVDYTTRFSPNTENWRKSKWTYHSGKLKATEAEPEQREHICHVYLPPLRDVQRELDSSDGHRLSRVIELLSEKADVDGLVDQANSNMEQLDTHAVVTNLNRKLQTHLTPLTSPLRGQSVETSFRSEQKLHKLVRNLRIKMAESGCNLGALSDSGLGYANLVFIALVILELENAQESELTIFLVEEPEAHLHPQLQIVLLEYLKEHAEASNSTDDSEQPAGRIQVIATTHSPHLTSITSVENIVVMKTEKMSECMIGERSLGIEHTRCTTKSVAVRDLSLTEDEVRKIDQYLDASRGALLFARTVMLIEGTAEAVLLPVFAKHSVFDGSIENSAHWRQQFLGVTIVAVGSVDFTPYIKLLLTKNIEGVRLIDKLIVLTDGDPEYSRDTDSVDMSISNRLTTLSTLSSTLSAVDCLHIFSSTYTLEADFLIPVENHPTFKKAFDKQHTRSTTQWNEIVTDNNPAEFFYKKLRKNSKYLRKGEFSHDLATLIQHGEAFICPPYIRDAIKKSVNCTD